MRYQSKSSAAYLFRNFGRLVYVALPVAVLMAFFANPSQEINFLYAMFTNRLTFDNIFFLFNHANTVLRFGRFWWASIITLFVLALTVSMLITKINRHMHVGEMPALPFKQTFRLFPITLLVIACFFCLCEIAMLLSVGVMYVLRGVNNVMVIASVGVALNYLLRIVCAWFFMLILLALPLKYSENYHLNVAMAYSVRIMTKQTKVVLLSSLTYLFGRLVIMLIAFFLAEYHLDYLLYAVVYLFVVLILPCAAYKLYYDVIGGERRDIAQIMFE